MTDRVVVVGGGLVGARCLEQLRKDHPDRELVLLSAEQHLPYDRPPLTKAALKDGVEPPKLSNTWPTLGIDARLGVAAAGLDPDAHTVKLADGSEMEYGTLVIATGADPRLLPGLAGGPADGVHVVRTLEDAAALRVDLVEHGHITIIGAGFIGCEVATTARSLGAEVVLLEALPQPLSRVLGDKVGAILGERHRASGVDVRTGAMVTDVKGTGRDRLLVLSDGSTVAAPVVLVALGVRPAVEWLAGSGIEIAHGVLCDAQGRTNLPDVYAAGDVAVWRQPSTGTQLHLEHWTTAASQAQTVARTIAGTGAPLDEVPYFWSDQLGLKLQMLGMPAGTDDVTVIELPNGDPGAERFIALYGRDGILTAGLGFGAPRQVMGLRAAIAAGADYADSVAALQG